MYRTSIYAEGNNITKSDLYQNGSHIKKRFNLVNIAPNNLDIHNNYLYDGGILVNKISGYKTFPINKRYPFNTLSMTNL